MFLAFVACSLTAGNFALIHCQPGTDVNLECQMLLWYIGIENITKHTLTLKGSTRKSYICHCCSHSLAKANREATPNFGWAVNLKLPRTQKKRELELFRNNLNDYHTS